MNYALETAEDVYKAVLDGIKKESTAVLLPEAFNRLINIDALTQWLNDKAPEGDFDQTIVDALSNLLKVKEVDFNTSYQAKLPSDYFRLQSVSFKIDTIGGLSNWLPVKRIRTDSYSMAVSEVNPWRKPTDKRLYYMQEGDKILSFPKHKGVKKAKLIYYARPRPIIYNSEGQSSHGSDLKKEQKKEIVDIAVRVFLERVKEERYQTQIVEKSLKERNQ